MRIRPLLAVLFSTAVMLAGCGGDGEGGDDGTDAAAAGAIDESASLRVAWYIPPQGVDPHTECHIGCRPYWLPIFETLYDINEDANIVPLVAAELPTYSTDGLELTIPLREGRTFRDGSPIDAEAVKASLERGKTLPGSTVAPQLEIVESIEVVDPLTVKLVLSQPRPGYEAELASGAGALISPKAIASGRDISTDPGDAGSGPYTLTSLTPNDSAVYAGDANYWIEERGRVAELTILGIPDVNTGINALQGGNVDAALLQAPPEAQRSQLQNAGYEVYQYQSYNTQAILLRITRGELSNRLARQAMSYAIDRETINETIYEGACEPTSQVFRDPLPTHVPDYDPFPYDPDRARQLLAEAGLPDGFSFDIVTVAGNPTSANNAAVVQQMLAEIGVTTNLVPMTSADGSAAFNRGEVDARSTVVSFRSDAYGTLAHQFLEGGPTHMAVPEDAELEELEQQLVSASREDAAGILEEMGRVVSESAFVLPICFQSQFSAGAPSVVGLDSMGYSRYGIWDPRELAVTG